MQLLAVGDLHLGRLPARLPAQIGSRQDARSLGPSAALARLVDEAIRQHIDAVAFAGDVVEQDDDFFEAYAELRRAVERLTEAGIDVVGVAGNHDVQVLPQLAREVPGFRLLGAEGVWEAIDLVGADGTEVRLFGWSFPRPRVTENPLANAGFERGGRPAIGLLHCDRDQPGSYHAPVTARELAATGLDAWLLGHIHKPDALSAEQPSGYLGSVTALRASEVGTRGPWLYDIGAGGVRAIAQWPLAPLRWEALDVDLTGIEAATDARTRILGAANALADTLATARLHPEVLGLRLRLHGRTALRRQVAGMLGDQELDDLPLAGGIHGFVGRWRLETRPELDLEALARRPDPVGLLAQRLLWLDSDADDPQGRALLERAREQLGRAHREPAWSRLDLPAEPDTAQVKDWLRRGALDSLDALLAQHDREASA